MEFAVVPLPLGRVPGLVVDHDALDARKLVVRGDDAPLPFEIAPLDGAAQGVAFQQLPHLGDVAQVRQRDRHDAKALLSFRQDQPVRGQARQAFAQRIDADVVSLPQAFELELGAGSEGAEQDISPDLLVDGVADRHGQTVPGWSRNDLR